MSMDIVVIEAEPDANGRFWCPEDGCDKSFARRHATKFQGFRLYTKSYQHYHNSSEGHTGIYCKSRNDPRIRKRVLNMQREHLIEPEQGDSVCEVLGSSRGACHPDSAVRFCRLRQIGPQLASITEKVLQSTSKHP